MHEAPRELSAHSGRKGGWEVGEGAWGGSGDPAAGGKGGGGVGGEHPMVSVG